MGNARGVLAFLREAQFEEGSFPSALCPIAVIQYSVNSKRFFERVKRRQVDILVLSELFLAVRMPSRLLQVFFRPKD